MTIVDELRAQIGHAIRYGSEADCETLGAWVLIHRAELLAEIDRLRAIEAAGQAERIAKAAARAKWLTQLRGFAS